jgi:hypothetical protein
VLNDHVMKIYCRFKTIGTFAGELQILSYISTNGYLIRLFHDPTPSLRLDEAAIPQ